MAITDSLPRGSCVDGVVSGLCRLGHLTGWQTQLVGVWELQMDLLSGYEAFGKAVAANDTEYVLSIIGLA